MTPPHNISGPTVRHELTRDGALVVELTAVNGPDIRLSLTRGSFDSQTPLGGRRITSRQATEVIRGLGRRPDDCQLTIARCWRTATAEANSRRRRGLDGLGSDGPTPWRG